MAVKNQKKKVSLSKKPVSKKHIKITRKKLLIGVVILLCLITVAVLSLGKTEYRAVNGPSIHSTAEASSESSGSAKKSAASAKANTSTDKDDKKTSTVAASGATSASASSSSSSGSSSPAAPQSEPFEISPPYGQVDDSYFCGPGSHTFNFTASITSNGPGTINYRWLFSDGATTPGQLTFTSASTLQLYSSWQLFQQDYEGWASLEVLTPFETASKPDDANFTMESSCGP